MSVEQILVWIVIGLISGWLASAVVGGGTGLIGDIVVGIAGAFLGGLLFRQLGWSAPFAGYAGIISVAFVGAVLLLVVIRSVRHATSRG